MAWRLFHSSGQVRRQLSAQPMRWTMTSHYKSQTAMFFAVSCRRCVRSVQVKLRHSLCKGDALRTAELSPRNERQAPNSRTAVTPGGTSLPFSAHRDILSPLHLSYISSRFTTVPVRVLQSGNSASCSCRQILSAMAVCDRVERAAIIGAQSTDSPSQTAY